MVRDKEKVDNVEHNQCKRCVAEEGKKERKKDGDGLHYTGQCSAYGDIHLCPHSQSSSHHIHNSSGTATKLSPTVNAFAYNDDIFRDRLDIHEEVCSVRSYIAAVLGKALL